MRLLALLLAALLALPPAVWAGPVDWQEVPATAEGRQWWDGGSLHLSRKGHLTVLSRFRPEAEKRGSLYVMELDCARELYRDTSVNGLPRFRPGWHSGGGDQLTTAVIRAACRAGAPLLAGR